MASWTHFGAPRPAKGSPLDRLWRQICWSWITLGTHGAQHYPLWDPFGEPNQYFGACREHLFNQLLIWCHFWLIFGFIFGHLGAKFGSILTPTLTNDARKRMPRIHMKKQHVFNSNFMRRRCVRGEKMCVFPCKYQCFLNVDVSRRILEYMCYCVVLGCYFPTFWEENTFKHDPKRCIK